MSGYGKVIDGGKQRRRADEKPINEKLEGFAEKHEHSKKIAGAVAKAYNFKTPSDQNINNIRGGKFETPKRSKNV